MTTPSTPRDGDNDLIFYDHDIRIWITRHQEASPYVTISFDGATNIIGLEGAQVRQLRDFLTETLNAA